MEALQWMPRSNKLWILCCAVVPRSCVSLFFLSKSKFKMQVHNKFWPV